MNKQIFTGKFTTLGIVIVIFLIAIFSVWFFNATKKITTYEECMGAGWLVRSRSISDGTDLFPNKYECILWGGKSFEKQESKTASLKGIEISLPNWYTHHISDTHIILTKQETLPDIGATEGYAYGEQININVLPLDISPEEWVAQNIDLDDILVLSKEWSTFYGQKLLVVESEAGGASGKQYTQYLFTDDVRYVISLYPLEVYDTSSEKYIRNTNAVYDARGILHRLLPHILEQESVRRQLMENCTRDISQRADDTSFDPENKIVTIWLWDEKSQESIALILPYEPETNFAGCSESAKAFLGHIQETVIPQ